ncbi:MAG: hypothetical protein V3V59_02865 [Thermodesulfovibrionales bacterium]
MSDINLKTGGFTQAATIIAINVEVGFVPKYVRIYNETAKAFEEWNDSMDDAEGIISPGTSGGSASLLITTGGITPILSSATDATHLDPTTIMGFTFGADTAGYFNNASDVYTWIAMR